MPSVRDSDHRVLRRPSKEMSDAAPRLDGLRPSPTTGGERPKSMTRKLFIVAKDNVADYRSLEKAIGGEPDVTVIYDRRHDSIDGVPHEERRRRRDIDEQLRSRGWAVVRISEAESLTGEAG